MRTIRLATLGAIVLLGASLLFGADSHEDRVAKATAGLNARRDTMLHSIDELDVALQAHGIVSNGLASARATLGDMQKSAAWRDLMSRSTKTQEAAKVRLNQYLKTAEDQLAAPRRQLALIKKAEFEAWARDNPDAAKILAIERRAAAAESAAMNAQYQAQNAESAAAQAQRDAEQAQSQAAEAERRARNAQQNAQRSEDTLRRYGINSW